VTASVTASAFADDAAGAEAVDAERRERMRRL
jgi:hypothetical protein